MRFHKPAFNSPTLTFAGALFVALLLALAAPSFGFGAGVKAAQTQPASKVAAQVLRDAANGGKIAVTVTMADQADLSAAYNMTNQDQRGWFVYDTLRTFADKSQSGLRDLLRAQGVAYQSLWIANALAFDADKTLIDTLAARSDVKRIDSNTAYKAVSEAAEAQTSASINSVQTVEWGVQNVNAPAVWAMGDTGQGIVVGGADTGIRWSHEALETQYRGWNGATANHNYNWYDAIRTPIAGGSSCGYATSAPCDDYFHGTHTIGSAVGGNGANEIGVAPGAKWIGCRNMDGGVGRPSTYMGCFQFMIAPTDVNGANANPALRAHVVNNSWGCPQDETCVDPNALNSTVEAAEASGVFVVSSAGNSGSACSTVDEPIAIYPGSFTVGAYDINNILAGFSSRGPVTIDGSNRLKPEIAAPGVSVRSTTNSGDSDYTNSSGTSMAAPHVAGVVALLWSAHPELARNIAATKSLLEQSANPNVDAGGEICGGTSQTDIPNNLFGYGRVDALAAINAANGVTTTPTATASATNTATPTNTASATNTATPAATNTPTGAATNTAVASGTATISATATNTSAPGATQTATGAPTAVSGTPTTGACQITFSDVRPDEYFYGPAQRLYCRGVISGYSDNTFRPFNNATRGQMTKIVVLAEGWATDTTGGPHFNDVPTTNPFYNYVETFYNYNLRRSVIIGYDDRTFRPYNNITRGQLTKIIVLAQNWPLVTPNTPTFSDVPPTNAFYSSIETAFAHDVISGYADGTFGWGNNATRGQIAKIVDLAVSQNPAK